MPASWHWYRACFSPLLLSSYVNYCPADAVPACGPQRPFWWLLQSDRPRGVHRRGVSFVYARLCAWSSECEHPAWVCVPVSSTFRRSLIKKLAGLWALISPAPGIMQLYTWPADGSLCSHIHCSAPLKSSNQEEISARICLKMNVRVWLHLPSATWHQATPGFTCTVILNVTICVGSF